MGMRYVQLRGMIAQTVARWPEDERERADRVYKITDGVEVLQHITAYVALALTLGIGMLASANIPFLHGLDMEKGYAGGYVVLAIIAFFLFLWAFLYFAVLSFKRKQKAELKALISSDSRYIDTMKKLMDMDPCMESRMCGFQLPSALD